MKKYFLAILLFTGIQSFSQSVSEKAVLKLSDEIFKWEVDLKIDSLANLFDEKLSVVTSRGEIETKEQYLNTLRGGSFKHDSIDVEQKKATIKNNTATVIGKGRFAMTVSGNKIKRHLSFMEVFIKDDKSWKLLAIYASVIPD